MEEDVKGKERELEKLSVEDDIQTRRVSISQKKALVREAKRKYGRDWKKILGGAFKAVRPNQETIQDMYSMGIGGDELRDMNRLPGARRRRDGNEA